MNNIEVDFTYPNDSIDIDPITTDDYDFNIFAVKGDKGDKGQDGADGKDGKDGQDGTNGQDGKGITSVSKTSTSGLVDTYTITYTDNTTSTFEVTNGANGQNGQDGTNGQNGADGRDGAIQYTAGNNITIENNVISAIGGASNVYNLGRTSDYTEENRLDLTGKKEGLYIIDWVSSPLYYQVSYNNTTYTGTLARPATSINDNIFSNLVFLELANKIESSDTIYANMPKTFFALKTLNYNLSNRNITFYNVTYTATSTGITNSTSFEDFTVVTLTGAQQITGIKTFNNLPQSSKVPTSNNQLVNKKYVDDAIATAIANL